MYRRTKIICTIGPAVSEYKQICKLIDAGMNVARINFSHGAYAQHAQVIEHLKKARKERGIPLAIMLDTKGPEIRIGAMQNGAAPVKKGQKMELVKESIEGSVARVTVTPSAMIDALEPKMKILFDDGYIAARVIECGSDSAVVAFENDGILKSNKGVTVPYAHIDFPAMTERDKEDISFGCKHGIDLIAASFIRTPDDIHAIKKHLAQEKCSDILVLAKIESALGVQHFDSILQVADGIMVARGDLGVELPLTHVPRLQKVMIRKTIQAFKPVITATQMLESMIYHSLPTRAEASDVANAIYDSTSAAMLSGETAVGKYPIESVKMMRSIIEESEKDVDYSEMFYRDMSRLQFHDISSSVALATVKTAYSAGAKALFAFTSTGYTAKAMSRFRPKMPIIAVTDSEKTFHQLALSWGIVPVLEEVKNLRDGFDAASCFAMKHKVVQYGDLVVITAGSPFGVAGTTNTMLVDNIGDVLVRGRSRKGRKIYGKIAFVYAHDPQENAMLKNRIAVITYCDESYDNVLCDVAGIILQNNPDEKESESYAKKIADKLEIPLITRADGASAILREGQLVTLDPSKGLVFKGYMEQEDDVIARVCHT